MSVRASLAIVTFEIWLFWLSDLRAESISEHSRSSAARALDSLLQDCAYKAFERPKTGVAYEGNVPSNLTGIKIAAMRLRSGSLRSRGVESYKEFVIPTGVSVKPYVERLVLVYQNLGNWSQQYYPLPAGYTYLAPVLGLLAYAYAPSNATQIPELNIQTSSTPILIDFSNALSVADVSSAKCVWFDLEDGSPKFGDIASGNTCTAVQQGHFSVLGKSIAPSPCPVSTAVWVISSCVLGGFLVLGFFILWMNKRKQRNKIQVMERTAQVGEILHMTSFGAAKAPVAMPTRTRPILETEYVP